jgi:dTDP-glucose 4,6-dehydratase
MEKILVTGGAGFIGSNFIRHVLAQKPQCELINIDALTYAGNILNFEDLPEDEKDRYTFVHADICDRSSLEKVFKEYSIDTVVHFAAESHVDRSIVGPDEFIKTNINGTFNLLEVSLKYWLDAGKPDNFRFHHVSTDEVYGSLGSTGYFTEETPYDPSSPYSASKAASDHLVNAYHRTYGLPTLITNCSNNYGPYQFPEKLIPLVILNIVEKKPLPVYGDGRNVRDWLYVMDHCAAILKVIEKGRLGETYNIGGDSECQNIDIVHLLCDIVDKKLQRKASSRELVEFVKDRPGHDRRYAIDASKIKAELGWSPCYQFEDAIEETVDWYLSHMDWVENVRSGAYREWIDKHYNLKS